MNTPNIMLHFAADYLSDGSIEDYSLAGIPINQMGSSIPIVKRSFTTLDELILALKPVKIDEIRLKSIREAMNNGIRFMCEVDYQQACSIGLV